MNQLMNQLMNQTEERIRQALAAEPDPYLGKDLIAAEAVTGIEIDGATATVKIHLGFPIDRYRPELRSLANLPFSQWSTFRSDVQQSYIQPMLEPVFYPPGIAIMSRH